MTPSSAGVRTLDRILGSTVASTLATGVTRRRLRVLAYHDVDDVTSFAAHLDLLTSSFRVVDEADVLAAIAGAPLPDRSVWITFDDGARSVVTNALPLLERHGLRASLFVCPALADGAAAWWDVVSAWFETSSVLELGGRSFTTVHAAKAALKRLPDDARRDALAGIGTALDARGVAVEARYASWSDLRRWLDAGHRVGNHTLDHPCLDRCSPSEQRAQIVRAHERIQEELGVTPTAFAYPNGNLAEPAARVLAEVGYRVAVAFDHRLARLSDPVRVSRLRVDDTTSLDRLRAILSGVHPLVHRVRARLGGRAP